MIIGVPKEIKTLEGRVAATPAGVSAFTARGHRVLVQSEAGLAAGFPDGDYAAAGAEIIPTPAPLWAEAGLILKVKEPLAEEYPRFRRGLTLFTYLHLAAFPELTRALMHSGVEAYGYETVKGATGGLPLLEPMSVVAGRMAPILGAVHLAAFHGGRGVLLPGVPGTLPARVTILGAGIAGENAARIALGLGADVTVLDIDPAKLRALDTAYQGRIHTLYSTPSALESLLPATDLLIGAVLIPGAAAPKLVKREHLRRMRPGSVFLDIAVDQGGCGETTRATTHDRPTFVEEGVIHYCVANMPGAYPRTSTLALTNAVLPYALRLADTLAAGKTPENAVDAFGLQVSGGQIVSAPVRAALSR